MNITPEDNKELVLFENSKIRRQKFKEEWFYSIVDIISILTEQNDFQKARKYWNKLKQRLVKEGSTELVTNCHQLKMVATDGKMRKTDCANRETIFRIIQSVPSPNAEPFKLWFARLAEERIQEINDPSLAIERARQTYLKKGYTEEWTNARITGIPTRNELTDEWQKRGVTDNAEFAILTDEISVGTFGISTREHKNIKKLDKEQNLRDNMSSIELVLTALGEVTTTELHRTNDSHGLYELKKDARDGGEIASITRKNIEEKTGKPVVTAETAIDFKTRKEISKKTN
ncbi:MAG TPA: phage antirepressor protein [Firmicutes bacterium]|nr:phage antirepressor protein [Bacillota bacterium]